MPKITILADKDSTVTDVYHTLHYSLVTRPGRRVYLEIKDDNGEWVEIHHYSLYYHITFTRCGCSKCAPVSNSEPH